jgi:hypothetical protein
MAVEENHCTRKCLLLLGLEVVYQGVEENMSRVEENMSKFASPTKGSKDYPENCVNVCLMNTLTI